MRVKNEGSTGEGLKDVKRRLTREVGGHYKR